MRATSLLVVVAAAVAVAIPAGPADARQRPSCSSSGSETVERTRTARIFTKRAVNRTYPVVRWYACLHRYDRRYRIGEVGEPGVFASSLGPIALAGRFVGYGTFYEGPAGGSYALVRVRDLRSGRELARVQTGTTTEEHDAQAEIGSLVVKRNASVAWIESAFTEPGTTRQRVRRLDRDGDATLDEGAAIDPGSLVLSRDRRTIAWTHAGERRTAALR